MNKFWGIQMNKFGSILPALLLIDAQVQALIDDGAFGQPLELVPHQFHKLVFLLHLTNTILPDCRVAD